ncbi:phosphoribosylamine--glycine ligase [Boudabousia tangfeifanii]|uniref:Phosphoribosylamine--glycine ligase n=1 Tax=Boudabousia tangfeifanii TaxID=1912795 RepID=A0A1D9MII2_9ACTO|nr:phosphoribosylamine--glycine ligase [Boudabousia tangfeifanii]AOZ72107.1 phosphoribosylamine--glycine ligase [Boudabousia tangfeifanii]
MNILLLGSGGREHALARSLKADSKVERLLIVPGNPGMAELGELVALDPMDGQAMVDLALREHVDLAVIGPEAPLVAGVGQALREAGVPVFGPDTEAAQLEGSKAFAKDVMAAAGVPTAEARVCTDLEAVSAALSELGSPYVVKADGLAAGKGVVVTSDYDEALEHGRKCLEQQGGQVLIEEYLDGPEVSLFCVCDGSTVVPLEAAQDFKRAYDGQTGPNTGGMGAYSPLTWVPDGLPQRVVKVVAQPVVDEMARRGTPFVGLLYCGLALTSGGLRVVEFNVRFGDPETQVVLARLRSSLPDLLLAAATGTLDQQPPLEWAEDAAVTVVLAANGYPLDTRTGGVITGIDAAESVPDAYLIHAGTKLNEDGDLVASGGRVLSVTALGKDVATARAQAYEAIKALHLEGSHYRSDIAASMDAPTA